MLRKLFTLIVCLVSAVATASAQTPPNNEIWYTTTDGRTISFNNDDLVSNSYNNGQGVLKFRDSVTSIEYIAFWGRSSLTSITIPNSVTSIGGHAFGDCSSLTSITIPNSVTWIGVGAFGGCSSLTSITIPNSVTSIGEYAFRGCNSLKSITIPNSVTSIEYGAFKGCSSLKSFAGKFASEDGRCLIIDGELIAFAPAGLTSYTIPNSVTSIEYSAFAGCSSLTSITIPNSVTSIGEYAFEGCSSLKSITISNSVTEIGHYAFYGCSSLTSITIPDSITYIGESVFEGCSSLTSITIPNSVTSIGFCAFAGCSSLTSITIGNSVTSIDSSAFEDCSSLKSVKVSNKYCYDYFKEMGVSDITFAVSTLEEYEEAQKLGATKLAIDSNSKYASKDGLCLIDNGKLILFIGKDLTEYTIPESVTSFRKGAFNGCSRLKSIKVANKDCYDYFKDKVAKIAFYGANASDDGRCLIIDGKLERFSAKGITEYTIPESAISIGDCAFVRCSSLTSITIPNSVTSIGTKAFSDCSSLTIITIPNSVTSIGSCAFTDCTSLTSITIPNSVTEIGGYAFSDCSSLKSVMVSNEYCYDYFKKLGVSDITFAVSTLEEYEEAQQLGATKLAIDSNSKYASEDGLCLIDNGKLILFIGKDLTEYTIPESVTSFREEAFKDCSNLKSVKVANKDCYDYFKDEVDGIAFYGANASADGRCLIIDGELKIFIAKGITGYTIPNSVTSIGEYAFEDCSSLKSITIPDSVTSIGKKAFWDCSSLTSITIPNSVTSIGEGAFQDCSSLTSITIPDSVTSIGEGAFAICSSLTSITIPNSVTSIGGGTFAGCSSLKSITIPNSVTCIGWGAFRGCSSLTSITIPDSVTEIGNYAFDGCSSLTSIAIPNSVTSIGEYAFEDCSSLKSITIPDSVTSIEEKAFWDCSSLTSITIPNSVTSIEYSAFEGCSRIKSVKVANKYCYDYFKDNVANIAFYGANASDDGRCLILDGKLEIFIAKGITEYTIPESVTSIGDYIFNGCSSLTSITIPNSVTSIGNDAFHSCDNLTSITCLATTPPAIDDLSIAETTMIYVPKEGVKAYKKGPEWSIYKKQIKAIK